MRIGMISSSIAGKSKDGLGSHVLDLSKNLSELGCDVHVFCIDEQRRDFMIGNIFVHSIAVSGNKSSRLSLYPEIMLEMTREVDSLVRKFDIDIVHGHGGYSVSAIIPRFSKHIKKFILTLHGVAYDEFEQKIREIGQFKEGLSESAVLRKSLMAGFYMPFSKGVGTVLYNLADFNIANCNFIARKASSAYHIPQSRIITIEHSINCGSFSIVDDDYFRDLLNLRGKKIILYVGQLIARKGVTTLLYAFSKVQKEIPEAFLLYVGKGYLSNILRMQAQKLGLEKKVLVYDEFIEEDLFPKVYSACNVFVMPSLYEYGPSTCLLQAMSSCKPAIASNIGAFPEMISNGLNGLLVDKGDPNQLARSILILLKNEEFSKKIARRGRDTVQTKFNWRKNVWKVLKVYNYLLKDI